MKTDKTDSHTFILCCCILAGFYLCSTLLYYSQIYQLYDFFDQHIISSAISGWAYLAQGCGLLIYILLSIRFSFFDQPSIKKRFLIPAVINLVMLPVSILPIIVHTRTILIFMLFLLNILIGFHTAFGFSLIAYYVSPAHRALCFALSYSVGGIGTWLISLINIRIMTSSSLFFVVLLSVVLINVCIFSLKNIVDSYQNPISFSPSECSQATIIRDISKPLWRYHCLFIALMAILTALGSSDSMLVSRGVQIDFLTTRLFYAFGLICAAVIFDYSHIIGGIFTIGSFVWPLVAIILYQMLPSNIVIIGLADTFAAFYTVYRAGIFMRDSRQPSLASTGLMISRFIEGIMVLLLISLHCSSLIMFLLSAAILILLIIVFGIVCMKNQMQLPSDTTGSSNLDLSSASVVSPAPIAPDVLLIQPVSITNTANLSFEEYYHLTRREEDILDYLSKGKTNKEIASELHLSESTVRFHVSNLLKKTGFENRNALRQHYNKLHEKP